MRKLLHRYGTEVEELYAPIDLTIYTKAPSKWKLIDMETGQEYIGTSIPNEYGCWIRIKDKDISYIEAGADEDDQSNQ